MDRNDFQYYQIRAGRDSREVRNLISVLLNYQIYPRDVFARRAR